jgi:hypothetical protein
MSSDLPPNSAPIFAAVQKYLIYTNQFPFILAGGITPRGSGARPEANFVCHRPSLLNPLVVRRFAPSIQRMLSAGRCCRARSVRQQRATHLPMCSDSGTPVRVKQRGYTGFFMIFSILSRSCLSATSASYAFLRTSNLE